MGFAHMVTPSETVAIVTEDPTDNRIIECAAESRSDYIVTGDMDLQRLGRYRNSRVVNAAEMIRILEL